jgi:hypothetical protein
MGSTLPNESIAQSYLVLQRLRRLVREAERSLTPRGVNTTMATSRISPQRRRRPSHIATPGPRTRWIRMRARVIKLLYLTAIAVAMMAWLWMLVEAIARALD